MGGYDPSDPTGGMNFGAGMDMKIDPSQLFNMFFGGGGGMSVVSPGAGAAGGSFINTTVFGLCL